MSVQWSYWASKDYLAENSTFCPFLVLTCMRNFMGSSLSPLLEPIEAKSTCLPALPDLSVDLQPAAIDFLEGETLIRF